MPRTHTRHRLKRNSFFLLQKLFQSQTQNRHRGSDCKNILFSVSNLDFFDFCVQFEIQSLDLINPHKIQKNREASFAVQTHKVQISKDASIRHGLYQKGDYYTSYNFPLSVINAINPFLPVRYLFASFDRKTVNERKLSSKILIQQIRLSLLLRQILIM